MAVPEAKTRKQMLNQKDEFVTLSARALTFVASHWRPFLFALLFILAAAAAFGAYNLYSNRQERQAALALFQARPLFMPLLARPEIQKGEADQALRQLLEVIRRYPRTPSALQATFYTGQIQYRLRDYPMAVQSFQRVVRKASTSMIRELALLNLGNAQEAMGDCRAAISTYRGVLTDKAILQDRALQSIGRCYETLGDRAKATEAYNQVLQTFPNSPWAEEIKDRLASLQAAN